MAYIGAQPNKQLTQTTSQSFNGTGSATAFTLNRAVNTGEELEVFVDNVQQEPGSGKSYTATGTTLTFDEAPPLGTGNVYVIYRGQAEVTTRLEHDANQALSATTGTFTSLNVPTIKDSSGTNTAMTINSSGLVLPKTVAFQVEATDTDQSYTASAYAKITWETVTLDTGSYWDTTNHRYTPQVAGWYLFGGTVRVNVSSIVNFIAFNVAKNGQTNDGTPLMSQIQNSSADTFGNGEYAVPTGMIQLNGSTDYVEVYFQCDENTTLHDHATRKSYFWGHLVHAT